MASYLVNDFFYFIDETNINVKLTKELNNNYILNESLRKYLLSIKHEIDSVFLKWDKYKKITNKYEFINTNVKNDKLQGNNPICCYKPISRSYFKLIEIFYKFKFDFNNDIAFKSFHLAEGPGGFIEATNNYRNNKNDIYYGFTLMDNESDVPKWNKLQSYLKRHKNIIIEYGPKRDGNLYLFHNLKYLKKKYEKTIDFITADGGFDYSSDFSKQEEKSLKLIYCEVVYALTLQKKGGSFVLKVFDIFHRGTIELIYLLCYFYEEVYVYKPNTSREANSEKYIVCKTMRNHDNHDVILDKLINGLRNSVNDESLESIFLKQPNIYFQNKIQEINAILGQQQIENILQTLNFIKDENSLSKEKINKIKQSNIKKCIQWCIEHNHSYYG